MRPRVFIGSSSEAKVYARAVQDNLQGGEGGCECQVWDQAHFPLSQSILDGLVGLSKRFDFAIFILAHDDLVSIRGRELGATRDNVIFETGLFMGVLGQNRVFMLQEGRGHDFRIPSDILGIKTGVFDGERGDQNWRAAVALSCDEIRRQIAELGPRSRDNALLNNGTLVDHVAAVCYRIENATVRYLLVSTTEGRSIFPKGKMGAEETLQDAALKYAWTEGGCRGRVARQEPVVFDYYKEELRREFPVAAYIVQAEHAITSRHKFRNPAWYDLNEAIEQLSRDRTWPWGNRLINALRDCDFAIKQISAPRYQAGVIPYKMTDDGPLVMLVTSRTNRAWILPKGNISAGSTPEDAAVREAFEEAGVKGNISRSRVGKYGYTRLEVDYFVDMFDLEVTEEARDWPERGSRDRKWVRPRDAINMVEYEHVKEALFDFRNRIAAAKRVKGKKRNDKAKAGKQA